MTSRTPDLVFQNLRHISWFWYEIYFLWHTSLKFHISPSGGPFGVIPDPINQFYVESILIIYGKHYIAFLSKNIINDTGEKHIIHFMDLPVVFYAFRFYYEVDEKCIMSLRNNVWGSFINVQHHTSSKVLFLIHRYR